MSTRTKKAATTPTAEQLAEKHGAWGQHPKHCVDDWQYEVSNGDTRRGYWDWVASRLEQDQDANLGAYKARNTRGNAP